MTTFLFTDQAIDDLPPKALEVLFAVQPANALNMVMSLARHPFMAEAALRAFEAKIFELDATDAKEFRRLLGLQNSENFLKRFDAVQDRVYLATGRDPLERALSAIQGHNQIFLERSISDVGNLNEMIDRKSLPAGTRLARLFDGADKANNVFLSKAASIFLSSARSEYSLSLEGQAIINAGIDLEGAAMRLESRKIGSVEYNHADLIIRTARAKELAMVAKRASADENTTNRLFSKALDGLIQAHVWRSRLKKTQAFQIHELEEVKRLITGFAPLGIIPSREALETPIKVRWTPEYKGSRIEEFEGPLSVCIPAKDLGVKPKSPSPSVPVPVSLWCLMAAQGKFEELKKFAEQGNDLRAVNPFNGFSALHGAAQAGRIEIVDFLIQQGLDEKAKDLFGDTPRKWWQDRAKKSVNDFDAIVQVRQARMAMDSIVPSKKERASP